MDASTRFDTQVVGAMPVIANYFDRIQLAATIDELVPWEGEVPLGALIEVLVLNRLLNPKAMFRIGDWAEKAGATDYFGLTAAELNDDRLGRALERIAEHGDKVQAALVVNAIDEFDLDISQIHYDITTIELYGSYENEDVETPPHPLPTYGHTKSGRKNVKQLQQGLSVAGDGGVPICHLPLSGNESESKTHLENLRKLDKTVGKSKLLYIADTKLDTPQNLLNITARKGKFLCGGAFQPQLKNQCLQLQRRFAKINYCSNSQRNKPEEQRDAYKGTEVEDVIDGEVDGRKIRLKYRLIYIWSQQRARDQAKTRERHAERIQAELDKVKRNLNKYTLTTKEAIVARLEKAKGMYSEGSFFQYDLKQRNGRFRLTFKLNPKEVSRRKKLEGIFVLKTNLPRSSHPLSRLLELYRDQSTVERRFGDLKGRLAVSPMFLKKPARMAGLLYVLVWALMALSLMERSVRKELKGEPMYGIYPENRPSPAPTGRAIFECYETLSIVIVRHQGEITRRLAELSEIQRTLARLLGVSPGDLRTYKRRCGM